MFDVGTEFTAVTTFPVYDEEPIEPIYDILEAERGEIVKRDWEDGEIVYKVVNRSLGTDDAWFKVNEKELSELMGVPVKYEMYCFPVYEGDDRMFDCIFYYAYTDEEAKRYRKQLDDESAVFRYLDHLREVEGLHIAVMDTEDIEDLI